MACCGGSCSEIDGIDTTRIRAFEKLDQKAKAFFLPGVCTECHKLPSEEVRMMACSKCRMVSYCGKECQKNNWTYHKGFCKATGSVATEFRKKYLMDTAKETAEHGMDFQKYLIAIAEAVRGRLNRKLDVLESKILWSPRVCEICKDGNPEVIKPCKSCYMVFYCSEKHANQDSVRHSKFCSEYFLSLKCHHLLATKGNPIPVPMPFSIPMVSEYKPMSGTMKDYMKSTFDSIDACLSESVSYPFSLLYALEHTGLNDGTKKVSEAKELTVLMGDTFNSLWKTMAHNPTWEYMFHLLPKLKKFTVVLCEGIKIPHGDPKPLDIDLCSDCTSRKCKFNVILKKDYRSYETSKYYKKPDVIYNHTVTNTDKTEKYLPYPEREIPLILLSNDKETMERGFRVMRETEKIDILLPLKLNPFRGIRPTRVPIYFQDMEDCGFLLYTNCYIVGLRRQVKGNSVRRPKTNHP